jgi:hypothetical protein
MSLEQTALLAEIIGGVALVISVIYLAYEVRSNTKVVKANAGRDTQQQWSAFNIMLSHHPARAEFVRSFDPEVAITNFDKDDLECVSLLGRALLQQFETESFQHQAGLLETEIYENLRNWLANVLKLPFWREWWANEREQGIYTQTFLNSLDTAKSVPVSPGTIVDAGNN